MPDFVGAPHVGSAVNVWWQGPNRWLPGVVQGYRTVTHQGAQSATVELSVALEDGTQSWHALHDTQFATYPAAPPTTQALVEHAGHFSDVPTDAPPCAVQFAMPLQLLPAPQPHGELQLPVMSHSMSGYLHPYASMPQMPFMHSTPLAVAPLISPQQLCVAPPSSLPPPPPPPAALPPPAGGAEACTPAHAPTPSPPAAAAVSLPPPADPTPPPPPPPPCDGGAAPPLPPAAAEASPMAVDVGTPSAWRVGDEVEARYDVGEPASSAWAEARLVELCADGCVVAYDLEGEAAGKQARLPLEAIRPRAPAEALAPRVYAAGDPVEARCDGVWWEGEVIESATMAIEGGLVTVHAQVRLLASGAVRVVDANRLRMQLSHPTAAAALARANARSPIGAVCSAPATLAARREGGGVSGLSLQLPKRQRRAPRAADGFAPIAPAAERLPSAERLAAPHALARSSSASSVSGAAARKPTELPAERVRRREDGAVLVRFTVPHGATGGQTLLLSVPREAEELDCALPAGAAAGETMVVYSSAGEAAHVRVPAGMAAGQRLLVSIALPAQPVHVQLPADARPGRRVQFVLPPPEAHDEQTAAAAEAAAAAARGRERERGKEERERGKEERERSKEKRRASDGFGGGNGRAASAPPAERKRERRQAGGEAAADEARDEARAQLRAFEAAGWQREPAALRELRQLPDVLDVWLRCEVLKHRLPLPPLTLPELERALCGLPPPDDAAEARESAELMGALHTALLGALQPPPPAADGWEGALAAAMEAGLWSAAHADAPLPLLQPLAAPKHCAWVTERGPSLCGTFGCTLPNNHLGLHQVPEAASRRRARRGDEAEPPAAAAAAAPPPRRAVPYAEVPPHARLALLSCLTGALLTPAEARLVERGGGAAYLGSDGEHGYWGVMRHYRLYRCKPAAAAEAGGALPLGARWTALCDDKSDCRRFAAALALFCRAAGADGAAARLLASRLRGFLTADDRRAVDEAVGKAAAAAEEERRRAAARSPSHRRAEAAPPPDAPLPPALASLAGLPLLRADSHGEAEGGGVVVRASLRVCKVPVGHRQLAIRAVLKLSIPRQRRISSTLKWRRQDYAEQAEQHKRAAADGERRGGGAEGGEEASDEADGAALEAERVLDHRVGVGGEPRYLVAWKGHGAEYNSWEPWTALAGSAALTARWHHADRAPAAWAAACPAQFESDPELPSWRVVTKRTSSGKVSKVFYGPKGEAVRSRSAALQICALYGKHGR
ncbi:hypothetical protein AB1Y20_013269 [Prymnesium parvum]|uniref:Chromo domain-containing protein n=1 Tax=Prymnesium parvum TaxID=97485 RepID=A0AB34ILN9_PRYPA